MTISGISRVEGWGRVVALALAGILALCLTGCTAVYRNHGYVPSEEELALVEVGKDTRETVAVTLGRPSAAGLLNDLGWYYVQSRWKHYAALPPQEIDRQVVAITFTEDGVVENVERFGLEKGRVVALSRRVTDTNVKGIGLLRQLLGSLGKIRADQILK